MPSYRSLRPAGPGALVALAAALALLYHHLPISRAAAAGPITWSGFIRVQRTQTTDTHCTNTDNNCEDSVHDFTASEQYTTEYRVERIPTTGPAQWSSSDVRVQVQGRMQSRSHGVNPPSSSNPLNLLETQMEGSGATVAGVSIFLRQSGEDEPGQCRIEFSPIGQRDDNGPLSGTITMNGTRHHRYVYRDRPANEGTEPHSTDIGPEDGMLDIPCAPVTRSLRGSRVVRNENGAFKEVTWDLSQDGEAQTEVVLIPDKEYDQWLPQAGESESQMGDFLDVRVVARERGKPGSKPPQEIRKYKIQLVDVSREPGVCLNWPPSASATATPDLKIDPDNPYIRLLDKDGQSAETKGDGLTEFMVTVNSHDWGAFGKLQVAAELKDGSTVPAHPESQPALSSLAIPKDDNSNHIADWWEHWFDLKNIAPEADDENSPLGDGHEGDSISLYEEYRGFRMQAKHERLSPEVKDLFIYDRDKLGLGFLPATGLHIHTVTRNEITVIHGIANTNLVSGNHKSHQLGSIWAIKLVRDIIGDGGVGETNPGPGVPASINNVRIDAARIAVAAGPHAATELKSTIAHELGHAMNLVHHGPGIDYNIDRDVLCRRKDGTTRNFLCETGKCFESAVPHGFYSGNDQCVLRYNSTDFYEDPAGNCEWRHNSKLVRGRRFGYDPPGSIYCESGKGTGVNDTSKAPNKAGDAAAGLGACLYKFCVNSAKH